jgi:hypothetical protein
MFINNICLIYFIVIYSVLVGKYNYCIVVSAHLIEQIGNSRKTAGVTGFSTARYFLPHALRLNTIKCKLDIALRRGTTGKFATLWFIQTDDSQNDLISWIFPFRKQEQIF